MAVFRINKTKNYTVMSNSHLKDKTMSLKAKGMLSMMLSLSDDWDYSVKGLVSICKEGKKAVQSTLKELEENYYLIREKTHDEKGHINYKYDIYEQPQHPKGCMDKGCTEKEPQLNTNILNTNNKDKTDKASLESHNKLTLELVKRNYISEDDVNLVYYDDLFSKLLEEYDYKDIVIAIHYIVTHLKNNNFKDENGNEIKNKYGYLKTSLYSNLEMITKEIDLGY